MRSSGKRKSAGFTVCVLLLTAFVRVSWADTLVMPQELVDFAHANGCAPIDNFFERPGMVNPPYVYGWLPGDQENSAVLWCKRAENKEKPYSLLFKVRDPKQLAGCPAIIEWWNPPRGLSIQTRPRVTLTDFRYVTSPKRAGPTAVITNAKVIVNYYDGLTDFLYCYKGQWLVYSAD